MDHARRLIGVKGVNHQRRRTVLSCRTSTREAAMRALRGVFVLVLALALPAPVLAADFQAGWEAYKHGDYKTALKEWRLLAEQGDAAARGCGARQP